MNYEHFRHLDDLGWEEALDDMTSRLLDDRPFCHIRFGDGELNAACDMYGSRRNCDGIVYTPQVASEQRRVFEEMLTHDWKGSYIPGGTCIADPRHMEYLKRLGYVFGDHYYRPNGWVPCHVIVAGVDTLQTLPMTKTLKRLGRAGKLWLVGSRKTPPPLESQLIEVGPSAIFDVGKVADEVKARPAGHAVMYCAGTPGKVMAWDAWKSRPDVTHLDMGHFFDLAYSVKNRMWHATDCKRREVFYEHFVSVIRGDS